jgi:uncharacterized membrane-anchored protein
MASMRKWLARTVLAVATLFVMHAVALEAAGPREVSREEFEAKLGYQGGTIALSGGMATIRVPDTFRFIGPEGSRHLLVDAWGNPPASATRVLGMLIPASVSPLTKEGWGIVITYDEHGYVDDKDAASMDYAKLLRDMQEGVAESNAERRKEGFETVTLVGWAEPPTYDKATHKLYWAKELAFSSSDHHTLNYNIRILGRRGVLVLNAVSGMAQLPVIRSETQSVLSAIDFNDGHRYQDYLPGKDKAATYGVAGLIVGATAAKAGLFKVIWVGLLAFKKAILAGLVAAGAAIKKLFGRQKSAAEAPAGPGPAQS